MEKILYIVHCVDTEGPLYESLPATFERLKNTFGIEMKPTKENLLKLKNGEGLPENISSLVMEFVSDDRLNYNKTLGELEKMLDEILTENWRKKYKDDFGNGYIFNWFIMDHIGYEINPRRRLLGYNVLFEFYKEKLTEYECANDEIQFHFHPVSYFREAHKCSNNLSYTNEHLQVLSRRVIDYQWFPSAFRPGMHSERPDLNLFLEMWIPFDYGNQAVERDDLNKKDLQKDLRGGRWGDWRRATTEWEIYHPDFYDYQKKGNMRRYIARSLNLNARLNAINEYEIEKAFKRAESGKPTIMAICNHDEREMRPYIDWFYKTVRKIQQNYREVKIKNSGAASAMQEVLGLNKKNQLTIKAEIKYNQLFIKTDKECWGPQPYFCFKTRCGQYIWENLDFQDNNMWTFIFDDDTIPINKIEKIGIATNDRNGNIATKVVVV